MGYDLHIERLANAQDSSIQPISLEEWCAAVAATTGVRLFVDEAHTWTNPKTGEVISFDAREGDAEVLFPNKWFSFFGRENWRSVFRWNGEYISFPARFELGDMSHPVWAAAVTLTKHLNAVIRGDQGEIYDLQTGHVIEP